MHQHAPACIVFTQHSQSIADLKTKLANQGKKYTAEALSYRDRIAELTLGFIKDDSVVRLRLYSSQPMVSDLRGTDFDAFIFSRGDESSVARSQNEADIGLCH